MTLKQFMKFHNIGTFSSLLLSRDIEEKIKAYILDYETKADVYASYERFCSDKNVGKESSEAFSRRLKKLAFEEPKQQRIGGGGKTWVWPNIKLRDYTKPDDEDQEVLDNS